MSKRPEYNRLAPAVNLPILSLVNRCCGVIQRWLYPPVCVLCGGGARGLDLCPGCAADLIRIAPACARCALPLPRAGVCGRCLRRPPAFDVALAAFAYRPPLDSLVKRLKFRGDLHLARVLGGLMAEHLAAMAEPLPEVIVPVPLHVSRLRERGFNQALELARPVARRLGLPLELRHVIRVRATDPQTDVPAKLRSRNVRNAFSVLPGWTARRVAIVDDVMTTGHTLNELTRTLRRAGVSEVRVWVCARAVFGR